jgi:hypothetical protein
MLYSVLLCALSSVQTNEVANHASGVLQCLPGKCTNTTTTTTAATATTTTPGGAVVEAMRYKLEGRGIDSRWCQWNFSLI